MNGKVVIGCELETKNFDKKINDLSKKLQDLDKKASKPIEIDGAIVTGGTNLTDEEINQYNQIQQQLDELYNKKYDLSSAEKEITSELKNQEVSIQQQNSAVQSQISNNASNVQKIAELSASLEDMVREYNAINRADIISSSDVAKSKELEQNIRTTADKIEKLGGGRISIKGLEQASTQVGNINRGLTNVIKKVGRWALAVFAVRSAYNAVTQSVSILSQYDTQLASNLEYIKFALANSLKPVIETILNLVVRLLQYINVIAKAWTGKEFFTSAKAFKSMKDSASETNKSTKGTAKNLKEASKELAGFDEATVLKDTETQDSGSSIGGGAAGAVLPSFDLQGLQGDIPAWLQWIVDNKDIVISALAGIAAGLIAVRLGFTPLQSLGIAAAVGGIVYAIQSLQEYLQDPSFENFGKVITGIGIAVAGLALAFGGLAAWPIILAGIFVAVLGIVISNWEKIKETVQGFIDNLLNSGNPILEFVGNLLQNILNAFDDMFNGLKTMFDGIIEIIKGIFSGDMDTVIQGIKDLFSGLFQFIFGLFELQWAALKAVLDTVGTWIYEHIIKPVIDFFVGLWEKIKEIFAPIIEFFAGIFGTVWENIKIIIDNVLQILGALWNGIKTIFMPVIEFFGSIFSQVWTTIKNFVTTFKNIFKEAWNAIKTIFSPFVNFFSNLFSKVGTKLKEWGGKVGDVISGAFKGAVNGVLRAIESILNSPIRAINGLISVINKVPGINLTKLKTFSLPRLAKGGIINQPGRGIPVGYGQAIGGERGQEGVLPLTDSQQMALLGEAIGKYVRIDNVIDVNMDSRKINRILQASENRQRLAGNR